MFIVVFYWNFIIRLEKKSLSDVEIKIILILQKNYFKLHVLYIGLVYNIYNNLWYKYKNKNKYICSNDGNKIKFSRHHLFVAGYTN